MSRYIDSSFNVIPSGDSGTSLTPPAITNKTGDFLTVGIGVPSGSLVTFTAPAGWTLERTDRGGQNDMTCCILTRITTSDDEVLPAFTWDISNEAVIYAFSYRGVSGIGAEEVDTTALAANLKTGPDLTTTADNSAVLHLPFVERFDITDFYWGGTQNARVLEQAGTGSSTNENDAYLLPVSDFASVSGTVVDGVQIQTSSGLGTDQVFYAIELLSDGTDIPANFKNDNAVALDGYTHITTDETFRKAIAATAIDPFTGEASIVNTFDANSDVNTTDDEITITGHGFTQATICQLTGANPPAGSTDELFYYIEVVDDDTIILRDANTATSTGNSAYYNSASTIDLTAVGSGTCTLTECRMTNHEAITTYNSITHERPPNSTQSTQLNYLCLGLDYGGGGINISNTFTCLHEDVSQVENGAFIFMDTSGNWSAFKYAQRATGGDSRLGVPNSSGLLIDPRATRDYGSGTLDTDNIRFVGFCVSSTDGSSGAAGRCQGRIYTPLKRLDPSVIVGGVSATPAPWAEVTANLQYRYPYSSQNTSTQFTFAQDITFGGGELVGDPELIMEDSERSIAFFDSFEDGGKLWHRITSKTISFDPNAASDISLQSHLIGSSKVYDLTVESTRPAGATIDLDGTIIRSGTTTLADDDTIDNLSVIQGEGLFPNAATLTDLTVRNVDRADGMMLMPDNADITRASFITDTPADYAIEIDATSGTFDMSTFEFTGFTTELNLTGTGGSISITLAGGQSEPDYDNPGGTTVTFTTPAVSFEITRPNILDGANYIVENTTQATEPANGTTSGGTGIDVTLVEGTDYDAGDNIRLRIGYTSGVTAKFPIEENFTGPAADSINDAPTAMVDYEVYNTIGIDGSSKTGIFAPDYVDDEIDITLAADFLGQDFMAWWVYNEATLDGLRTFFGVYTLVDEGNMRNNNSVLSVMFDNTTTTNIKQIDNVRIYRADAAYPVRDPSSGGGCIDIVWREKVLVTTITTAPGTSVVTGDISDIRATLNNLGVNIQQVNGYEVGGQGTDSDPWNPA